MKKQVTLAITGASGVQYALCLLCELIASDVQVSVLISRAAEVVINTETSLDFPDTLARQSAFLYEYTGAKAGQITLYGREDWFSPVASGSSSPSAMVICPASGGTLSAIAYGASNNLIERAADVALKERRQLIVVPRETPYSEVHLSNMLKITQMGGVVLPASPGFYQNPETLDDMYRFVVARILDQLQIPQQLLTKWGEA